MYNMIQPSISRVLPDLSWVLSFDEAEAWAVKSFHTSLKVYRERLGVKLGRHAEGDEIADSENQAIVNNEFYFHPKTPIALEAAIRAFNALYVQGSIPEGKPHKPTIIKWLKDNYGDSLSVNARNAITSIVNINKNGGAPKTPAS
jgi:hypothetical protein